MEEKNEDEDNVYLEFPSKQVMGNLLGEFFFFLRVDFDFCFLDRT